MGIPTEMETHAIKLRLDLEDKTVDLRCAILDLHRATLDQYSIDDVKRAADAVFASVGVLTEIAELGAKGWRQQADHWTDEDGAGK